MNALSVLLKKEFLQFVRNPFMPKIVVAFPIMIMFVIPWVTTMDVKHVALSVVDNDHSSLSERIVKKLETSDYFTLQNVSENYSQALSKLEEGHVDVIVEIPKDFEKALVGGNPIKASVSANGVNSTKGNLGSQYTVQVVMQAMNEFRSARGLASSPELMVVENRFNPTLDYRNFMIPALMIMLLVMLCGFLPALNLVGEKEKGTIEQINVTPVSRLTFTLAKLIPYWIIGVFVLSLVMLLAGWVYDLWPAGSVLSIYLGAVLFVLAFSGLGVIVANISDSMQQAMFVMFFFIIIFILLSGLMTPIDSMPSGAQLFTYIMPPRYFIEIMRSVYLKGTTIVELYPNYLALVLFAIILNSLAAVTYKKQA